MHRKRIFTLAATLTMLALILSACGASTSNESIIATSVAMTVQAQDTQRASFTQTPAPATDVPSLLASPTGGATKAPPTAPPTGSAGTKFCTASATFISETIPDGTIMDAGSTFTKIWRIKNSGTCAWDATWKLVFVSGDLMGAAYSFNFPQPAAPNETVDVPIVFTAPQENGDYRGYWKIESPWGLDFGDSGSGNPFWVDIVVGSGTPANNKTATVYGVTAVSYDIARNCRPANTDYTITAYITTNGPVTVIYEWQQSDTNNDPNNKLTFSEATTKSVVRIWSQNLSSPHSTRWIKIIITSPTYQEYSKAVLPDLCY